MEESGHGLTFSNIGIESLKGDNNLMLGGVETEGLQLLAPSFSIGCTTGPLKNLKKVGRKGSSVKLKANKGGGNGGQTMQVTTTKPLVDRVEGMGSQGGKRKTMMDELTGFEGDDVTMDDVYDAGKRLKTNVESDGVRAPLTVAEVGGVQPREEP